MIKQNKTQGQKVIMYSKEISNLPTSIEVNNSIPVFDEDTLVPRVFPDSKIPLRVAIMRKIKTFEEYDISSVLGNVDWKYGCGLLELIHYDYSVDAAVSECSEEIIQKKLIKGRAYHHAYRSYKHYLVTKITMKEGEPYLAGCFTDEPT